MQEVYKARLDGARIAKAYENYCCGHEDWWLLHPFHAELPSLRKWVSRFVWEDRPKIVIVLYSLDATRLLH